MTENPKRVPVLFSVSCACVALLIVSLWDLATVKQYKDGLPKKTLWDAAFLLSDDVKGMDSLSDFLEWIRFRDYAGLLWKQVIVLLIGALMGWLIYLTYRTLSETLTEEKTGEE